MEVTGHIDFGKDFDEAVLGIGNNFLHIFLCVETAVVFTVRGVFTTPAQLLRFAPSSNFGEFGVLLNFNTPTLVFRQVPVEAVHLICCHHVENALHFFLTKEVATFVKHKSAPTVEGFVGNAYAGNFGAHIFLRSDTCHHLGGEQLLKSLKAVEETCGARSLEHNSVALHLKAVTLIVHVGIKAQLQIATLGVSCSLKFHAQRVLQLRRKAVYHALNTVIFIFGDIGHQLIRHLKLTRTHRYILGLRDKGERLLSNCTKGHQEHCEEGEYKFSHS